jgi:nucleotide-binding universal stress UspA family protein
MIFLFKTVVFPYDFSHFSESVVPYIKEMKSMGVEKVIIVSVLEYEGFVLRHVSSELEIKEYREKNKARLDFIKKEFESVGLDAKVFIDYGIPSKIISSVVVEEKADLIVMASLGAGFSHNLLGSTVQNVLKISQIPVLIVPAK